MQTRVREIEIVVIFVVMFSGRPRLYDAQLNLINGVTLTMCGWDERPSVSARMCGGIGPNGMFNGFSILMEWIKADEG